MYLKKDSPKKGDFVIATIKEISDISIKTILNEYENFIGFIPIDELSSKRITNIREVAYEDKVVVCYVLDVDEKARIATLSLKRVDENRRKAKISEYKKERQAYFLLKSFCEKNKLDINKLLDKIIYKGKKLFEIFNEVYINGYKILENYEIDKKIAKKLYDYLKENYSVPMYRLRIILDIYSMQGDGIISLKKFLEGLENLGFSIKYLGAPTYAIQYNSYNPREINEKRRILIDYIENNAKKLNLIYQINEE
ncbi:MAG: S1 RNA-binding domain-containing protein [Nanopusillaceae archaeon]